MPFPDCEHAAAYKKYADRSWFPDPYVGPPASKSSTAWKFWRESGAIEPAEFWRRFPGSVLLLFAQLDTIGDPNENTALFAKTMAAAGNKNYTIGIVPGADHSMYAARTGSWHEVRLLTKLSFPAFNLLNAWLQSQQLIETSAKRKTRRARAVTLACGVGRIKRAYCFDEGRAIALELDVTNTTDLPKRLQRRRLLRAHLA